MPEPGTPEWEERVLAFQENTRKTIEAVGFQVMGIVGDDGSMFSYTVGFWETKEHPEVLICDLPTQVAHDFFWELWERIEEGEQFKPGERYAELAANDYLVEFREIPPPRRPLNVARRFYGGDFPALQMVFPDRNGWFPGDELYDPKCFQRIADGQWD